MSSGNKKLRGIVKRAKDLAVSISSDDEIEIHSNRLALITGCKKLTEYSREKVSLSFGKMDVEITGEELEPESLINGQMALRGIIRGVTYIDH